MRITMIVLAGIIAALISVFLWGKNEPVTQGTQTKSVAQALVTIALPDALSANAQIGQTAYIAKCSACHGIDAVGRDGVAPPLVHKIYGPNHHGDEAFQRAVALGVQGHHWPFGNMPPVDGLNRADVALIVRYIRELQQANGIN